MSIAPQEPDAETITSACAKPCELMRGNDPRLIPITRVKWRLSATGLLFRIIDGVSETFDHFDHGKADPRLKHVDEARNEEGDAHRAEELNAKQQVAHPFLSALTSTDGRGTSFTLGIAASRRTISVRQHEHALLPDSPRAVAAGRRRAAPPKRKIARLRSMKEMVHR